MANQKDRRGAGDQTPAPVAPDQSEPDPSAVDVSAPDGSPAPSPLDTDAIKEDEVLAELEREAERDADQPDDIEPPDPSTVVTHRVLRPFQAEGFDRLPGELVDASSWRTARSLEAMRYIAPVDSVEAHTSSDGRLWVDLAARVQHEKAIRS